MNLTEQLIREINSGSMTIDQLEVLLAEVSRELTGYLEALDMIKKAGKDNWTYEVYAESLHALSAGEVEPPIERQRWNQISTKDRLEMRTHTIKFIEDAQREFETFIAEAKTELGRQREAVQKSGSATQKKRWQFWK